MRDDPPIDPTADAQPTEDGHAATGEGGHSPPAESKESPADTSPQPQPGEPAAGDSEKSDGGGESGGAGATGGADGASTGGADAEGTGSAGSGEKKVIINFSSPAISFFGVRSAGTRFAFVLDISGSMAEMVPLKRDRFMTRFDIVAKELRRSIDQLGEHQTFTVAGFNDQAYLESDLVHAPATEGNKRRLDDWLESISPQGGTDPSAALREVLSEPYDAVFLLSDGEFHPYQVYLSGELNRHKTVIHTISMFGNAETLKQIAQLSKGQFRIIK